MRLDQFVFRPGTVYEWRLDVTVSEIPDEELRRYLFARDLLTVGA